MNVYDFDNTILRGDSTARFFAWSLRHCPGMWRDLPAQAVNGLMFVLRLRKKQDFKQRMLSFLRRYPDPQAAVEEFWNSDLSRVKRWYLEKHREDDVVISASPAFLIGPACARLGISRVMGSPVDPRTGRFLGPNCHGREKVRRFRQVYPDARVEGFFSDSHSDDPMAELAERAWLVRGDRLLPWEKR